MGDRRTTVAAGVRAGLESDVDGYLAQHGFRRRKNSLIYTRCLPEARQSIEICLELSPLDCPDAIAAVYPMLEVGIPTISTVVIKMLAGKSPPCVGTLDVTLRQPIDFTAAKQARGRWYITEQAPVPRILHAMRGFLEQYTVPFLEFYTGPDAVCTAYDRHDARVVYLRAMYISVAAAMLLTGRPGDALAVMERWFGQAGYRRDFQPAIDYCAKRLSGAE